MILHKIDVATGNFIEDCQFANLPISEDGQPDPQYVEEAPPQGLYLPRWTGTKWVEGGAAPEPTTPQLSTDEKLTQMAEQLVITQTELEAAQEVLDFLLLGGM